MGTHKRAAGRLPDTLQHAPLGLPGLEALQMAPLTESREGAHHALAEQIFGTGPWQWAGHTGLVFLRGGRLVTPWGTGTWGVQRRGGAEKPPSDANVFADFGGGEHTLSVGSWPCLNFKSVRKTDGEKVRLDYDAYRRKQHNLLQSDPANEATYRANLEAARRTFEKHQSGVMRDVETVNAERQQMVSDAFVGMPEHMWRMSTLRLRSLPSVCSGSGGGGLVTSADRGWPSA